MKSLPVGVGAPLSAAALPQLRAAALAALLVRSPREKAAMAGALFRSLFRGELVAGVQTRLATSACDGSADVATIAGANVGALPPVVHLGDTATAGASIPLLPPDTPGRPDRPVLVDPRDLARRSVATVEGRCVMLHAIAHIEFNAINLALDAVARFDGMPIDYYRDWTRVAAEEGYHFTLLADRLEDLGSEYGAYPAHDGLWEMAQRTKGDVLARMALVPRTLEARGLDAAPPIRAKLAAAGDTVAAGILDIILRDEIGHVAIGNRWYRWLCARASRNPLAHYAVLARDYRAPRQRGPFNLEARRAAGFDEEELAALTAAEQID